jgi:hypothetical protein
MDFKLTQPGDLTNHFVTLDHSAYAFRRSAKDQIAGFQFK